MAVSRSRPADSVALLSGTWRGGAVSYDSLIQCTKSQKMKIYSSVYKFGRNTDSSQHAAFRFRGRNNSILEARRMVHR